MVKGKGQGLRGFLKKAPNTPKTFGLKCGRKDKRGLLSGSGETAKPASSAFSYYINIEMYPWAMACGLMLAKSLPFGKHDAGEHVPAGKRAVNFACRTDRLCIPTLRVQHGRVFALWQTDCQHRVWN